MISVDDAHTDAVEEVSRRLEQEGAKVEHTIASIGAVTATAPADSLDRLRRVKGVGSVEAEGEMTIAPPDSPVQ